jgi:hypothetical protein
MNFEHLIEINDPDNPLVEPLSRQQLWRGLVMRAENPELSVIGLDACVVLERKPDYLRRELRFGHMRVNDEVFFTPLEAVRYEVMANELFPSSSLVMRIEEPFPGRCFLRFTYSRTIETADDKDEMVRNHLKQAYIQTDQDTVAVIRELAKMGKLGTFEDTEYATQNLH